MFVLGHSYRCRCDRFFSRYCVIFNWLLRNFTSALEIPSVTWAHSVTTCGKWLSNVKLLKYPLYFFTSIYLYNHIMFKLHFFFVTLLSLQFYKVCECRWETQLIGDNTSHNQLGILKITNNNHRKLNIFNSYSPLKISTETPPLCHSSLKSYCFLLYFLKCEQGFILLFQIGKISLTLRYVHTMLRSTQWHSVARPHSKSRTRPQVYVDIVSARLQHAVRCCVA